MDYDWWVYLFFCKRDGLWRQTPEALKVHCSPNNGLRCSYGRGKAGSLKVRVQVCGFDCAGVKVPLWILVRCPCAFRPPRLAESVCPVLLSLEGLLLPVRRGWFWGPSMTFLKDSPRGLGIKFLIKILQGPCEKILSRSRWNASRGSCIKILNVPWSRAGVVVWKLFWDALRRLLKKDLVACSTRSFSILFDDLVKFSHRFWREVLAIALLWRMHVLETMMLLKSSFEMFAWAWNDSFRQRVKAS